MPASLLPSSLQSRLAALIALALPFAAGASEFYPIVTVTSSRAATDLYPAARLIQGPGTGFTATAPHTQLGVVSTHRWATNKPIASTTSDFFNYTTMPVLRFDLGADVLLGEISVWGYDAASGNGVSQFSLRFATEAEGNVGYGKSVRWNPVFGGPPPSGVPNDPVNRMSFSFSQTVTARYVEMTVLDNWWISPGNGSGGNAPGGDRVGLGEVAFEVVAQPLGDSQINVTEVNDTGGELALTFLSSWPEGVSYQPQFSNDLSAWTDIPDATVTPTGVVGNAGRYLATAPKFGGARAFYRVIVPEEADVAAPIAHSLFDAPPPTDQQLLLISTQNTAVSGQLLDYAEAAPGGPSPSGLQPFPLTSFGSNPSMHSSRAQDTLTVDLDGNGTPDPLFCWANNTGLLHLVLSQVPVDGSSWNSGHKVYPLTGSAIRTDTEVHPIIRLVAAQLDDDEQPEVVVAWNGSDGRVHLRTVDFNGDVAAAPAIGPEEKSTVLPVSVAFSLRKKSAMFDLAAGNFDGSSDGLDEVAVVAVDGVQAPADRWRIYAKFYRAAAGTLTPVSGITPDEAEFYRYGSGGSHFLMRLAAEAADFDGDGADELVAGYHTGTNDSEAKWYLRMMKTDTAMTTTTRGAEVQTHQSDGEIGWPMGFALVNLDDDPAPEIIYTHRVAQVFDAGSTLTLTDIGFDSSISTDYTETARRPVTSAFLGVAPVVPGIPDIVIARDQEYSEDGGVSTKRRIEIDIYKLQNRFNRWTLLKVSTYQGAPGANNNYYTFSLAAAHFTPLDIRLGMPRRYTRTLHDRPTVILNAPPVHFDSLNGTLYDVNNLFPTVDCSPDCPFNARFIRTGSKTVTVETQWKRSWDVSIEVSGGGLLGSVGVEAAVHTKFGEEFNNYTSSTETTTVTVEINAVDDDRIYATTVNYTIWEYPVLLDDKVAGHIILVEPDVTRNQWFSSKGIIAQNYRPYHEVGNLLSYRNTTTPYDGAPVVREILNDTFEVGPSAGNQIWSLTRTAGATTTDSRTFNFNIGATASFDIPVPWIPAIKVSGDYTSSSLASTTSTVTDSQGLEVKLGILDGSIAGTSYSVTPYVYWDRSGAVVLDYAVDLPAGTPSVPTYWGQKYGALSDPAFILPWRLDPEKGLALTDNAQRQLSRDIITLPAEPRPGQTVNVAARLSNFSLLDNPGAFNVRFHLGDPAAGGPLLHQATVAGGVLKSRGKHLIQFPWTVPESMTAASFRIYAVIDPTGTLAEIHEDNNKAWNEIFLRHGPELN